MLPDVRVDSDGREWRGHAHGGSDPCGVGTRDELHSATGGAGDDVLRVPDYGGPHREVGKWMEREG